jgi:5-methylcytosine-specific restriction protein B
MMPDYKLLAGLEVEGVRIDNLLRTMNERIEVLYDREHTIGHAFFMSLLEDQSIDNLAAIFSDKILPLLAEYFFEDWQKIRLVLGDNQKTGKVETQFILEQGLENDGAGLFGSNLDLSLYGLDRIRRYVRNPSALSDPDAYIGVYDSTALQEE